MNKRLKREEPLVNLEYHKGELCVHSSVLCQEGYCSECIIHHEKQQRMMPRYYKNKAPMQKKHASKLTIGSVDQKKPHIIRPQP